MGFSLVRMTEASFKGRWRLSRIWGVTEKSKGESEAWGKDMSLILMKRGSEVLSFGLQSISLSVLSGHGLCEHVEGGSRP